PVPDELVPVFADVPAAVDVFLSVPIGGGERVGSVRGSLRHVVERDEQVLSGRPCLPEPITDRLQVEPLKPCLAHPVGGRRTDRRCATDYHVLDCDRDVLSVLRLVDSEIERKVPLVDQLHHAVLEPNRPQLPHRAVEGDVHEAPPTPAGAKKEGSKVPVVPAPVSSPG